MLIPIGTDLPLKRQPTVTYFIIAINLLVCALQWALDRNGGLESTNTVVQNIAQFLENGALSDSPNQNLNLATLFTHLFIHEGWRHILGNMIFLLPFGKAVEDRIGHIPFAILYLVSGAIAGFVQVKIPNSDALVVSVIGASGSVAAITAAFVVLAPSSKIKVLFIFFIISILQIPSLLFVAFYILLNLFNQIRVVAGSDTSNIGHLAHLVGYTCGLLTTIGLLAIGFIPRSQHDLLYLTKQLYRRRKYRSIVSNLPERSIDSHHKEDPLSLLIASITQVAATGDPLAAADQYLEALDSEPSLHLHQKTHSLLARTLIQTGRIEDGVRVYEMYLQKHNKADDLGEVALLLVAKYTRDLHNDERARELLHDFSSAFSESHQSLVATLTQELEQ